MTIAEGNQVSFRKIANIGERTSAGVETGERKKKKKIGPGEKVAVFQFYVITINLKLTQMPVLFFFSGELSM